MVRPCESPVTVMEVELNETVKENVGRGRQRKKTGSGPRAAGRLGRKRSVAGDQPVRQNRVLQPSRESNGTDRNKSDKSPVIDESSPKRSVVTSPRSLTATPTDVVKLRRAGSTKRLVVSTDVFGPATKKLSPKVKNETPDPFLFCSENGAFDATDSVEVAECRGTESKSERSGSSPSTVKHCGPKVGNKRSNSPGSGQPPSKVHLSQSPPCTVKSSVSVNGEDKNDDYSDVEEKDDGEGHATDISCEESDLKFPTPLNTYSRSKCARPGFHSSACNSVKPDFLFNQKSDIKLNGSKLSLKHRHCEPAHPVSTPDSSLPATVAAEPSTSCGEIESNAVESLSQYSLNDAAPALSNLGNTCYLNSILQVLYHTPSFTEKMTLLCEQIERTQKDRESLAHFVSCPPPAESRLSWKFVFLLLQLLKTMRQAESVFSSGSPDVKPISPTDLYDHLGRMNTIFEGQQQQDSHETYRCILTYIQDAIRHLNAYRVTLRNIITSASTSDDGHKGKADGDAAFDIVDGFQQMCSSQSPAVKETRDKLECEPGKIKVCVGVEHTSPSDPKSKADSEPVSPTSLSKSSSSPSVQIMPPAKAGSGAKSSTAARHPANPKLLGGMSKANSLSKITNFFSTATSPPKSVADVPIEMRSVIDFVEQCCGGMMQRSTRCLECERVSSCSEHYQDIEVVARKMVDSSSDDELDSCDTRDQCQGESACWIIDSLDEVERLQAENKYSCENCRRLVEAERFVEYGTVPNILTIHIKRFSAFGGLKGSFTKTMDCVNVPFELPCFEKDCRNSKSEHRYELYAVVCHTGMSLSSGHYLSYIRAPPTACIRRRDALVACASNSESVLECKVESLDDNMDSVIPVASLSDTVWYKCDDDTITALLQSDFEKALLNGGSTTPYMVFYKRVNE